MPKYWLTPPDLYQRLNAEFRFDCDPCPYPRPEHYNSLIEPWGRMNFVHPPYSARDCIGGTGPTSFARKAIGEYQWHGNGSVVILPVPSYVNMLIEAGAELRPLGRVAWLEAETKEPWKTPCHVTAFVLPWKK